MKHQKICQLAIKNVVIMTSSFSNMEQNVLLCVDKKLTYQVLGTIKFFTLVKLNRIGQTVDFFSLVK